MHAILALDSLGGLGLVDDLLTTRQLQELLRVDRITIYRMLNDGRLHGFKVGGQWRFSRQEIESWLQEQRPESGHSRSDSQGQEFEDSATSLPLSCVQAMQTVYAEALDIAAVTTNLQGVPLTQISNSCDFCTLVLSTAEGRRRCASSWQTAPSSEFVECHAGLLCAAQTVRVNEHGVARFAACQFVSDRLAHSELNDDSRLARELGLDREALAKAAVHIRKYPKERLDRVLFLLDMVADTLGKIGQQRADFFDRLQRIAELTEL